VFLATILKDIVLSNPKLLQECISKAQSVLPQKAILFAFICTDVTVNATALIMVIYANGFIQYHI